MNALNSKVELAVEGCEISRRHTLKLGILDPQPSTRSNLQVSVLEVYNEKVWARGLPSCLRDLAGVLRIYDFWFAVFTSST